ncbi:MAG: type II secretion system minor pseudopilin GspJ, partial [Hyphococcus sp.]
MRRQNGFTLPEVLVALLIFSLVAAASVYALRLGVDSRDQLSAADAELKQLQLARTLIKEDFAQVAQRPVRDEFGILTPAHFHGGQSLFFRRPADGETQLIAFTRSGWTNPNARAPRSTLQYVEYLVRDNALIRRARVYPDEAPRSETLERVLFTDIDSARMEFLVGEVRRELQWAEAWPVSGAQSPPPRAVALITTDL